MNVMTPEPGDFYEFPGDQDDPEHSVAPEESEPRYNVKDAMYAVWREVGVVRKDGTNEFHRYKYTSDAEAIAAIRPALVKHSLMALPSFRILTLSPDGDLVDSHGNVYVEATIQFFHVPSRTSYITTVPGAGNDRSSKGMVGDKAVYKAMTGAEKYALLKTFMIETREDAEIGNEIDRQAHQSANLSAANQQQAAQQAGSVPGWGEWGFQTQTGGTLANPKIWTINPTPRPETQTGYTSPQIGYTNPGTTALAPAAVPEKARVFDVGVLISELSMAIQKAQTLDQLNQIWDQESSRGLATVASLNQQAYLVLEERFRQKAGLLKHGV